MGEPVQGKNIQEALHEAHIEFVVALPDIVTCDELLWPIAREITLDWSTSARKMRVSRSVQVCHMQESVQSS